MLDHEDALQTLLPIVRTGTAPKLPVSDHLHASTRVLVALCMLRQWAQKQIVTLRLTIMAQQHIARGALNERFATSDGHGGS
jgi:hypothetical protein